MGRYVERQVLAQAVTWHVEDRVIVDGPDHRLRLTPPVDQETLIVRVRLTVDREEDMRSGDLINGAGAAA